MEEKTGPQVNRTGSKPRGWLLLLAAIGLALIVLSGWLVTPGLAQQPTLMFDLAISKSAVPSKFTVGSDNDYVISVFRTNAETVGAAVIVEDRMPTGLSITEISAQDWNCFISVDKTSMVCTYAKSIPIDLFSLPPIFIGVDVPSDVSPEVVNTATLNISDGDSINNTDTITTTVDSVDLGIKKTQTPSTADVGDIVTYTLEVTNYGPSKATNVIVKDTLSTSLTFITATPNEYNPSTGIWTVGDMNNDSVKTLSITAIINSSANGQLIKNVAEVSSSNVSDWNSSNNKAETTLIVGGLEISKSVDKTSAFSGEPVKYTILVRNQSSLSASGVVASDIFPSELDIIEYKTTHGSISFSNETNKLTNYISSLASNTTATITVIARPDSTITTTKTISNTATLTWGYPQLSDISQEIPLIVKPAGAINVSKSDGLTSITPGQVLTYTVNVRNIGSLTLPPGVIVKDTIPANSTLINFYEDTLPGDLDPDDDDRSVQAELDEALEPDEEVSFRVVVETDLGLDDGDLVINRVEAWAPEGSTADAVSYAYAEDVNEINIAEVEGMRITLSVNPAQAKTGDSFTFKIVVSNTGDSWASNVNVTGTMPTVLDYVSNALPAGTSFTANTTARSYTWSIGTLRDDESRTLTMVWKANTSVTVSNSYNHFATLNWNSSKSLASNTVKFRITPSSTLPGTGFGEAEQQPGNGLSTAAILLSTILGLLGAGSLAYSVYAKKKQPLWANWFLVAGVILFCGGALFGVAAWGFQSLPTQEPQQLSAISHATQAPENAANPQSQPTDFVEIWGSWATPTPDSLPDYAIPAPPDDLNQGPYGNEPDSSAITRILIPRMGLDTVVKYVPYDGSSWLIGGLKQEIAWMGDTSWPGLGGNTGLAGHVDLANGDSGPFWNLADLKPGDQITVWTELNKYIYTMREFRIVGDSDLSVIEPTTNPQLTLITCAGWDPDLRLYLERMVVFADLVKVEPLSTSALGN